MDNREFNWGRWHHLAGEDGKSTSPVRANFEPGSRSENVEAVVEQWNAKWVNRGVRVALEVRGQDEKA